MAEEGSIATAPFFLPSLGESKLRLCSLQAEVHVGISHSILKGCMVGRGKGVELTFHQADLSDSCRRSSLFRIQVNLLESDDLIRSSRATLYYTQEQRRQSAGDTTEGRWRGERDEADLEAGGEREGERDGERQRE